MKYIDPKFDRWSLKSLNDLFACYKPAFVEFVPWVFVIEANLYESPVCNEWKETCKTDSIDEAVNFMLSHALQVRHPKADNYEFIVNCSYENFEALKALYDDKLTLKFKEIETIREAKLGAKSEAELAKSAKEREEEIAKLRELAAKYPGAV